MRPRSRSTRVAKSDWLYVVMESSSIFVGSRDHCVRQRTEELVSIVWVAIAKATRKSGEIWWPHGTQAGGQSPTLFTAGKNQRLRIAEGSKAVVLAPFSRLLSANGRRARRSARAIERRRGARGE